MQTHSDLIHALGGYRKVAEMCGVPAGTASSWASRGSIPNEHWAALVEHGDDVTFERLATLAPKRRARVVQGAAG